MKTLYLTDLDGTLLRDNERISPYTAAAINRFIENGGCFSYATARSIVTASKVTEGLNAPFPVICGNGVFIMENITNKVLYSNFFTTTEIDAVTKRLKSHNLHPMVHSYINGRERVSYIEQYLTNAMRHFLDNRKGDTRIRIVTSDDDLYQGDIFRFSCMDTDTALSLIKPIFESDTRLTCLYTKEVYSGEKNLEILPLNATKANAARQLKAMLGCDKIVAFGDGLNDISLFEAADEKYATANAVPELKRIATAVIGSNEEDGVAKWIEQNAII